MSDRGGLAVQSGLKLENCPFCGGESQVEDDVFTVSVVCEGCGAKFTLDEFHTDYRSKSEVVAAWNTRALPPSSAPLLEALEGIYVASRASLPERPAMWRALRDAGWPIISTWIDEAEAGQTEDLGELWSRIQREVTTASGLIFYAEPEDFPLKGAYVEIGMAMAAGVPIIVVAPGVPMEHPSYRPIGSWLCHPGVRVCATLDEARAALAAAKVQQP